MTLDIKCHKVTHNEAIQDKSNHVSQAASKWEISCNFHPFSSSIQSICVSSVTTPLFGQECDSKIQLEFKCKIVFWFNYPLNSHQI